MAALAMLCCTVCCRCLAAGARRCSSCLGWIIGKYLFLRVPLPVHPHAPHAPHKLRPADLAVLVDVHRQDLRQREAQLSRGQARQQPAQQLRDLWGRELRSAALVQLFEQRLCLSLPLHQRLGQALECAPAPCCICPLPLRRLRAHPLRHLRHLSQRRPELRLAHRPVPVGIQHRLQVQQPRLLRRRAVAQHVCQEAPQVVHGQHAASRGVVLLEQLREAHPLRVHGGLEAVVQSGQGGHAGAELVVRAYCAVGGKGPKAARPPPAGVLLLLHTVEHTRGAVQQQWCAIILHLLEDPLAGVAARLAKVRRE
mmetsp:Transcript_7688/g.19873  ORF Transcript_7688/g.19873 Transcript_7688/m.19873 type:complete len:311 (-) Transcript_7688:5251-6183(-)